MADPAEVKDPDDEAPSTLTDAGRLRESSGGAIEPPERVATPPEIQAEIELWLGLGREEQRSAFRDVIAGRRSVSAESMVHMCRRAHEGADRAMLNLAFEALSKIVTPQLLSRAWGLTQEDRRDQAQQILMEIFAAIQSGKTDLAENRFAAFATRRAVSLYRKRKARFEGAHQRVEPTAEADPVDLLPDRIPSAEARALLSIALDKMPTNHRAAFIQYHLLGRTQEEIAIAKDVDVRTVRTWLKKAGEAVGFKGDEK